MKEKKLKPEIIGYSEDGKPWVRVDGIDREVCDKCDHTACATVRRDRKRAERKQTTAAIELAVTISRMKTSEEFGEDRPDEYDWEETLNNLIAMARNATGGKPVRTLHTIAFIYSDNAQPYNEGAMLTADEAKQVLAVLEERERAEVIYDAYVSEDANPLTFAECMKALKENNSLQWEDCPETKEKP